MWAAGSIISCPPHRSPKRTVVSHEGVQRVWFLLLSVSRLAWIGSRASYEARQRFSLHRRFRCPRNEPATPARGQQWVMLERNWTRVFAQPGCQHQKQSSINGLACQHKQSATKEETMQENQESVFTLSSCCLRRYLPIYLCHSPEASIWRRSDRHRIGIALANLDDIQDRIYFCLLTSRPVHLEHSSRLPYNSSPAEETAEVPFPSRNLWLY
jgi:hypothetical protein